MCTLIHLALDAPHAELVGRLRKSGFEALASENVALSQLIGPNALAVSSGGCSCELVAGAVRRLDDSEAQALRRRYRRKGWSQAKIERALSDADAARQRNPSGEKARRFAELLGELLEHFGELKLFAHEYSGSFEHEALEILARRDVERAELHALLQELPFDTLLRLRP